MAAEFEASASDFWLGTIDGLLALVVEEEAGGGERIAYASSALLRCAGRSADEVHDAWLAGRLVEPRLARAARAGGWAGGATLVCAAGRRQACVVVALPLAPGEHAASGFGPLALWVVARLGEPSDGAAADLERAAPPAAPSAAAVAAHWRPLLAELVDGASVIPLGRRAPPTPPHPAAPCGLSRLLSRQWRPDRAAEGAAAVREQVRASARGAGPARAAELPDGEPAACALLPLSDERGVSSCAALLCVLTAGHAQALSPLPVLARSHAGAPPAPLLGEGSVGSVRLAAREPGGAPVALKSVDARACAPGALGRTWAEAAALARLRARAEAAGGGRAADGAARVNRLLACVAGPRYVHLVLSAAPGVPLQAACEACEAGRAPPLRAAAARALCAQLAAALGWLRACGVYHRDVKPANAVVHLPSRTLTLVDFNCAGLVAREERPAGARGGPAPPGLCGSPVLTPLYAAPEVLAACAEGYEPFGADVWGCGCVLLQMLLAGVPAAGGMVAPSPAGRADEGPSLFAAGLARLRAEAEATPAGAGRGADGALRFAARALAPEPARRASIGALLEDEYVVALAADAAGDEPAAAPAEVEDIAAASAGWLYGGIVWRPRLAREGDSE